MPKQLIPIANVPLIEHVLAGVRAMGVTETGIVSGDWTAAIMALLGTGERFGMRLTYLRQRRPLGLAHAVRMARRFLGADDFVLHLGDVLLTDDLAPAAADFACRRPAAHVLVQKVADPREFGVVELDPDGAVCRLVEKPRFPAGDLALTGVYFFTPEVHDAVAAITPSARGELEITDAVQWLLAHGRLVTAARYTGFWRDTGRAEQVLECNAQVLAGIEPAMHGRVDAASRISGPVTIGAGAAVLGSVIEGPVVIGAGARITGSRIGPDVSVGAGCTIRDTRLTNSIVMDGAVVTGCGSLHGSLIGRGASVGPADDGGQRMLIGDHVRVELAAGRAR